jgi:hypothetical protein
MIVAFLLSLRCTTVADLTKESFFSFTGNEAAVNIVHFYGRNCDACTAAEDTFEELSRMYYQEPRVRFGQLDCDRYSDICDSQGANSRPAWLVWLPANSHSKPYNRNIDVESFERWLRQQTGIWPRAKRDNLLYTNRSDVDPMLKKTGCLFAVVDTPRLDASQPLHAAARSLERKTRRGSRFVAIDARENPALAKKLLGASTFGGFVWAKGKAGRPEWVKYERAADADAVRQFLDDNKCGVVIATPTPTPEALPELPELDDFIEDGNPDEPSPADRAKAFKKQRAAEQDQEGKQPKPVGPGEPDVEEISEWSNDDDGI